MIIDQLSRAQLYRGISSRLDKALDYLQNTDFSKVAAGKHEIDGDNIYALVMNNITSDKPGVFEAHRRYIDVQYIVEGAERMDYADLDTLTVDTDYDAEDDAALLKGEGAILTAKAGTFLVFFPTDGHIPGKAVDKPQPVTKVVVKVKV